MVVTARITDCVPRAPMLAYFRHKPYSFRSSVAVYTHMSDKSNTSAMMEPKLTQKVILRALDFAYEKALEGPSGLDSAWHLARDYKSQKGSPLDQVNSLIRWQNTKAATSGFITGLGGLITLPVSVPANITSVLFIQVRMIAAIAIMGGHDVNDDKVKTLVYACLAGNAAKEVLRQVGIQIGEKLTISAIKSITRETLVAINQAVGFRLLTKFGEKGAINLGKAVPVVGGVVGATFEAVSTNTVGNVAKNTFIDSRSD